MRKWLILPALAVLISAGPAVTNWQIQHPASSIGFIATGGGQKAEGTFARYVARIRFDPANLPASSAVVAIDVGSAVTGQKAVDDMLRDEDWFNVAKTPQAVFTSSRFEKAGANYVAHGQLKIRGISRPVTLPFTLAIDKGQASVAGKITIDRTQWSIGVTDEMANSSVSKQVIVTINVKATALGDSKKN